MPKRRRRSSIPDLLQQGERDVDEARRTTVFSAHIVPIPAFGTKRVEMEYQERIPVERMQSLFALPLRPDAYRATTAGKLRIEVELLSPHASERLRGYEQDISAGDKRAHSESHPGRVSGDRVALNEDFSIQYSLDPAKKDTLCGSYISRQRVGARILRSIGADRRHGGSGFRSSTNDRRAIRYVIVDAMGKTGAELHGPGEIAARVCDRSINFTCWCSTPKVHAFSPQAARPMRWIKRSNLCVAVDCGVARICKGRSRLLCRWQTRRRVISFF